MAGFRIGKTSGAAGFYELTATNDRGIYSRLGKHLYFHGIEYEPFPWLSIGINESLVGGGSINPVYLVPLSIYFADQWRGGYAYENSLFAMSGTIKPINGLVLDGVVYVDDPHLKDMLSLNWDTKWKLAAEFAAAYYPEGSPIRSLRAAYTMVAPYNYTHIDSYKQSGSTSPTPGYNLENYTHFGRNFGPDLDPNSDRVCLVARFAPDIAEGFLSRLGLEAHAEIVRHGNASAGVKGCADPEYDGSLFDSGWVNNIPTFQPTYDTGTTPKYFRFLTQDIIEYRLRAGLGLDTALNIGDSPHSPALTAAFSYELEQVWNASLVKNATETQHYLVLSLTAAF